MPSQIIINVQHDTSHSFHSLPIPPEHSQLNLLKYLAEFLPCFSFTRTNIIMLRRKRIHKDLSAPRLRQTDPDLLKLSVRPLTICTSGFNRCYSHLTIRTRSCSPRTRDITKNYRDRTPIERYSSLSYSADDERSTEEEEQEDYKRRLAQSSAPSPCPVKE